MEKIKNILNPKTKTTSPPTQNQVQLFIIHKETDKNIATILVDYIKKATGLKSNQIMCSSVVGCQIPTGGWIAGELKKSIEASLHVIAICSYTSVESKWVVFELGASWVLSKSIITLVGPGVKANRLPAPILEHSAIYIQKDEAPARISEVVRRLAEDLGLSFDNGHEAIDQLNKFVDKFRAKKPRKESRRAKVKNHDTLAVNHDSGALPGVSDAETIATGPATVTIEPHHKGIVGGVNTYDLIAKVRLNEPPTQGMFNIKYLLPIDMLEFVTIHGLKKERTVEKKGTRFVVFSCQITDRLWPGETKIVMEPSGPYRISYAIPLRHKSLNDEVLNMGYELYLEDFPPVKGQIPLLFWNSVR